MYLSSSVFKLQEIRVWVWAKTLLVAAWWSDLFVEWDQQLCWKLGDLGPRHYYNGRHMCKINGKTGLTECSSVEGGTQGPWPSGLTFRLILGRAKCATCYLPGSVPWSHGNMAVVVVFLIWINSSTWNVNKNIQPRVLKCI